MLAKALFGLMKRTPFKTISSCATVQSGGKHRSEQGDQGGQHEGGRGQRQPRITVNMVTGAAAVAAIATHLHQNSFTGSGFKLGADATAPSEAVEGAEVAKEPRHFVLKMWKDGFSIDDEDIRKYDDPANREFLQSVMRGSIPPELVEEAKGREVHLDTEYYRQEDFVKPKTRPKAFGGKGNVCSIAPSIEQPGVLLGMGNPLLDISAEVNPRLLRKHNLKPNDAILTTDEAIFEDMSKYAVTELDFIPGGATQNSIRVAQWILPQKNATAYFGCVGSDATSQTLAEKAREAGVNVQYQINTKYPTGRCAVLITGHERSLVTKLDAAAHYNVSHLEEADNWKTVEAAKVVYSAGFFLTVSVESMLKVAQHCADNDKTYCLNLAAPFLIQDFKDQMMKVLQYTDIVFGNETEARTFALVHFPEVKDLAKIALKIFNLPKENCSKGRLVVITQGSGPVIVVEHGKVLKFPVSKLPKEKIVDTNGAGDAFVGGFLAQYVQDKPLETAVRCGIWAATQIIQRSGCTYTDSCDFKPDIEKLKAKQK